MRRTTAALTAALTGAVALGLGALTAAPADAAVPATTTITSPASGARVDVGTRSIRVHYGRDVDSSYSARVEVHNDSYTYDDWSGTESWPYPGETHTFSVAAMTEPGDYTAVVVDDSDNTLASTTFAVADLPVRVSDTTVTPAEFNPVVRDGYKDTTRVAYTLNKRAAVTIDVYRASDDKRVRHELVGTQGASRHRWTWNGRNNAGNPVGAGRYRVEVDADAGTGNPAVGRTSVTAVTAVITRHGTSALRGNRAATSHRGNCSATRLGYFGEVDLDCWAGVYAQAVYSLGIPANATHLHWHVSGETGCCSQGRITKTGRRVSPRTFRVTVRVTNWRAFTVTRASVSYAYRVTR